MKKIIALALCMFSLTSLLGACSNAKTTSSDVKPTITPTATATSQKPAERNHKFTPAVISGALIDNYDNEGYTKFSFKCSYCENIDKAGGWNQFSQIADTYTTPYSCQKCSKITNVEIRGIFTEQ